MGAVPSGDTRILDGGSKTIPAPDLEVDPGSSLVVAGEGAVVEGSAGETVAGKAAAGELAVGEGVEGEVVVDGGSPPEASRPGERARKMKAIPSTPASSRIGPLEIFSPISAPNILKLPPRIAISSSTPPSTSKPMAML